MPAQSFDALTRNALERAASTRRAALLAFAAGALGLADSRSAGAKKRKKRRKKNKDKKAKKLAAKQCQGQVTQCFDFATAFCPGSAQPQQCQANADLCCARLGECDINAFLTCLIAAS